MYYLYKYLDSNSNECLYIGQTKNLYTRHLNHLSNKKEEWCNDSVIMKYIEVPDKDNLNFLEMYLINKELPKFNTVGKKRMDIDFLQINIVYEWKTYTKYDFIQNSIEKGEKLGVSYKLNYENYNLFKQLVSKNKLNKIKYSDNMIESEFESDYETINSIDQCYLLEASYKGVRFSGSSSLISIYQNWKTDQMDCFVSGKTTFCLHVNFLKSIIDSLYEPTKELYELLDLVNDFLELIGVEKDWKQILNDIENM
ncbi:GIY-YIG nuclease family protein [Paraclostridium sordellii 8483]|uniref:GIY-YIG nuclease family protein n=1 Tax=Paraclostridium sordellii TaxID=1505 RepID=UPI00030AD565|nr:GIY-YIG nuclease family protein [Paeniclostridium sordellii]TAN66646.1 GIY-YIG nuclease family protein [Paeniclostridium sordellii 8483]